MRYSFIIPCRNPETRLKSLVARLRGVLSNEEVEFIVVEQCDASDLPRGPMLNAGAERSRGEILVFHDLEYDPGREGIGGEGSTSFDPESYDPRETEILSPIRRVVHVTNDLKPRDCENLSSGCRHSKERAHKFFSGVIAFRRAAFFRMNGFNSIYRRREREDPDLRARIRHYQLTWRQGNGSFYLLDEEKSCPPHGADIQREKEILMQWRSYLAAGVSTPSQTVREITPKLDGIDHWFEVASSERMLEAAGYYASVEELERYYDDTPERHADIWLAFEQLVNNHKILREHRNWVFANNFGYGSRPFHWMWNIIVNHLPQHFKFLEIGVYMGQVVSLVSLLSKTNNKEGLVVGITPLTNAGDKYSKHPQVDYRDAIGRIYSRFGMRRNQIRLIEGLSNDKQVIAAAKRIGPYDAIYVDGCHDYEVVKSDIEHYAPMLKIAGLLIIDDASTNLQVRHMLPGFGDVGLAVRDTIEGDVRFKHLFAVGHNRVWRRLG